MLSLPPSVRVFLARDPCDMRKGFDGLEALVRNVIRADPLSGHLFCFCNRRRDRLKILVWDSTGYLLIYKRLEAGRFSWDRLDFGDEKSVELIARDLLLLLEGIDLTGARRRRRYNDQRKLHARRLVH